MNASNLNKIEIKSSTFIPDNLWEQESDMVYLLPFRDNDNTGTASEVLVYILMEHQSTVDRTMGFCLLLYMCQIWDSQRREFRAKNLPKHGWRFEPIIPIIFYTGDQKWETFPSLETLMDLPEALNRFVPKFGTLLLDVKRAVDEQPMLNQIVSENHPFLDISEKKKQLMQSMAEHYLQQGETRAKREVILKLLQIRFHFVNTGERNAQ